MVKSLGPLVGAQSELSVPIGPTVTQLTVPAGANAAIIDNGNGSVVRYTTTGVASGVAVGNRLPANSTLIWLDPLLDYRALLLALKMSGETAGTTINVQYYAVGGVA